MVYSTDSFTISPIFLHFLSFSCLLNMVSWAFRFESASFASFISMAPRNNNGASSSRTEGLLGPEFTITKFYASKGILHQTNCVNTPQHNARVERKHQHILIWTRNHLLHSHMDSDLDSGSFIVFFFESTNIIKCHPRKTQGMDETRYKWCRI